MSGTRSAPKISCSKNRSAYPSNRPLLEAGYGEADVKEMVKSQRRMTVVVVVPK
ncbi:MAG: hypothetical protein IPK98_11125 [Chloracidobacterium sp.]|nr:hypothetical protein [Chloracidobacterium sp.]